METEVKEVKHWKRPDRISIDRKAGWAYRYVRKDQVQFRLDEGWEVCYRDSVKKDQETKSMDGAIHHRSLILMRMPQHMADERNQYYLDKHKRRLRASMKGASLSQAAENVNRTTGEDGLITTIGKAVQTEIVNYGDGKISESPVKFDGEVTMKDLEDMAEVKEKQQKDLKKSKDETKSGIHKSGGIQKKWR